jgi:hypothetical protein
LLSPEYVAVTASLPSASTDVTHVATPGFPVVTAVVPHPVFALHATVPPTSCGFTPRVTKPRLCGLTSPYSPPIVAVNVTACP